MKKNLTLVSQICRIESLSFEVFFIMTIFLFFVLFFFFIILKFDELKHQFYKI